MVYGIIPIKLFLPLGSSMSFSNSVKYKDQEERCRVEVIFIHQ